MKKLLTIITCIILGISMFACGNTSSSSTSTVTSTTTETINKEITVSETVIDLPKESEYNLEYSLNFELNASEALVFSSSDDEVASVNMLGKIKTHNFGTCTITIHYNDEVEAVVEIHVNQAYEIVLPSKTIYNQDETINLSGGFIRLIDEDENVITTLALEQEMIVDQLLGQTGSLLIEIDYQGVIFGYEIFRLNPKQEDIVFDDFIYLNQELHVGERLDFALTKGETTELLQAIDNIYDYEEINIYGLFVTPDAEVVKVDAFWYQEYEERLTEITINPNLRLEGKVNDLDDDLDVFVNLAKSGNPHFRMRYLPKIAGEYEVTLVVEVDGDIIQTFVKSFTVDDIRDDGYKGYVRVDQTTKRNFVFDNGESYLPVGQNVAWYTSVERKHYDYLTWFSKMGEVGMNYARVWMAAWGYSLFWDDVYNYDQRQDNLFSLDKTMEYAEDNDIYIQLCILHHGMFSSEVNPMWPDSSNTWYVNRYGANPYGSLIDDSGLFFTDEEMKVSFKNQLTYIIARYGFSDHIMSFELFNEVDWIETYEAGTGLSWHQEMADFLKAIDPNQHLVTTSLNNQSFLANNYKVFKLNSIDYVNVHHYGIYNHTDYLPDKQYYLVNEFDKPVNYNEIGYSGNGGEDQYTRDPSNITLHQGLWAGMMGGGAGTGMHWWWESWVETYDAYDSYFGVATYASKLNLSGTDQKIVYSEDNNYNSLSIDSIAIGYMGYQYNDRLYLYIFDKSFTLNNQSVGLKQNKTLIVNDLNSGNYQLEFYDTFTGNLIASSEVHITESTTNISLPNFNQDIAMILKVIE